MTTTDANKTATEAGPPGPKLGYTKDGTPVWAHTSRFAKMDTSAQRFNAAVGLRITVLVGTMWAAYVFAAVALISLPDNIHSTQLLILWISSSFLQLVLLPIIIVGQNIQARGRTPGPPRRSRTSRTRRQRDRVRALDLLDVHTAGGLHDAVQLIIQAVDARGTPGAGAGTPVPAI